MKQTKSNRPAENRAAKGRDTEETAGNLSTARIHSSGESRKVKRGPRRGELVHISRVLEDWLQEFERQL